jgi:hypothetical protein
MVFWTTTFRIATKDASRFLMAAKRLIKEKCGFEWTVDSDVGQRITKIHLRSPTFGYRVDLRTPWEVIHKAEEEFKKLLSETDYALLELAEKYGASVEVFNGGKSTRFVQPKQIIEAEAVEKEVVKLIAETLKNVKPKIDKYEDIVSLDSIIEQAKRNI